MAHNEGTFMPAKDRRRATHARSSRGARGTFSAEETTTVVLVDPRDEDEPRGPRFLEVCWPAVFGILVAIIADQVRLKVIAEWGDTGDRLVFPFVRLLGRPELGLGDLGASLSQLMLYLQFPLTGLYATWNLSRGQKLSTTVLQIAFTYGVIAFVLWLMTAPGSSHGL
jgi:hypothetical protein